MSLLRSPLCVILALSGCAPTFVEKVSKEPGAVRLPSGNIVKTLRPGDGPKPGTSDRIHIAWQGRFVDGKVFSSAGSTEVGLSSLGACFREVLARMNAGEKVRVVCLPDTEKSDEGPKVPSDTTADFELELVPAGQAAEEEIKLPAGLVIKVTRDGTGPHPKGSDTVKVNYEGRLADGKVFDSSIERGEPATFPLGDVIPCWRLALQKMKVGDKATLTCPPEVAYGKKGSPPSIPPNATLTFEVELLGIEK
jgi:FKBP-type peptidyl-prolyl cis-trans isomerase FkpA